MASPPVARATFNVKWIGITALVAFVAFCAYMLAAKLIYQENVQADESEYNSGSSTIERKEFPKGFAEDPPPAPPPAPPPSLPPAQQQHPRSAPAPRAAAPEKKEERPLDFGFGKIERPEAGGRAQQPGGREMQQRGARGAQEPEPDLPEYARQGLSGQKRAFAKNAGQGADYVQATLQPPISDLMIRRSRIIPAVMTTAPSTEMPGNIFAMVTEDIRDSITGKCVLIPATTIVSGEINDMVEYGASAAQGAWTGLSFPDGSWIDLGSMPATNAEGRAGLYGRVNRHTGSMVLAMLGSVAVRLLGQVPQYLNQSSDVTVYGAGGSAAASAVADPMSEIVTRELNRENTIDLEIGDPAPLLLMRDIALPAWGECDV